MSSIHVRLENQINAVADDVSALPDMVRQIMEGILYSVKQDVAVQL